MKKLYDAFDNCNLDEVIKVYREILSMTDEMQKSKANEAYRYIINNWDGILNQKLEGNNVGIGKDDTVYAKTEGYVKFERVGKCIRGLSRRRQS